MTEDVLYKSDTKTERLLRQATYRNIGYLILNVQGKSREWIDAYIDVSKHKTLQLDGFPNVYYELEDILLELGRDADYIGESKRLPFNHCIKITGCWEETNSSKNNPFILEEQVKAIIDYILDEYKPKQYTLEDSYIFMGYDKEKDLICIADDPKKLNGLQTVFTAYEIERFEERASRPLFDDYADEIENDK